VPYTLQPWQVFLREENHVLLEQLGDRRIRLAVTGKAVGRRGIIGRGADQVGRVS